jgi:endonuclease-3
MSSKSFERPSRYRVRQVLQALAAAYPDARTALHYETPWQLLVATILSAQCTDRRVNLITARLFQECPDAASLARLSEEEIQERIRECGLYRTKARNLARTAREVLARYGGDLPRSVTREELMQLPGVGRKTANVVMANAFGAAALAVDTHVFRVAHRLGWSAARDADGTERDLTAIIPRQKWASAHHWLILHGRAVCHARRPDCAACVVARWCPSRKDTVQEAMKGHEDTGRRRRSHVSKPHRGGSAEGPSPVRVGGSADVG